MSRRGDGCTSVGGVIIVGLKVFDEVIEYTRATLAVPWSLSNH